jgi:hypothetical protein
LHIGVFLLAIFRLIITWLSFVLKYQWLAWFHLARASRKLLAATAADVIFPDDYPNSVKHVLLIGTVGFAIGSIVFMYLSMTRKKASVAHSLTFLSCAVAAMAYYCMWNGFGVEYKTSDITPRVIFWARHLAQIFTVPVRQLTVLQLTALCIDHTLNFL